MCFDEMWRKLDATRRDLNDRGYKRAPGRQLSYVNVDSHNTVVARAILKDERYGEVTHKPFEGVSGVVYLKTRGSFNVLNEQLKGHQRGKHSACAEAMIVANVSTYLELSNYETTTEQRKARVLYMISEYSPCSECETKLQGLRNAVYNLSIEVQYREVFGGNYASTLQVGRNSGYSMAASLSGSLPGKLALRHQLARSSTAPVLVLSNPFAALSGSSTGPSPKPAAPRPLKNPSVKPIVLKPAVKPVVRAKSKPLVPKPPLAVPNPLLTCSACAKTRAKTISGFFSRWHQCSGCDRVYCDTCGAALNSVPHAMFTRERMCGSCNTITALID